MGVARTGALASAAAEPTARDIAVVVLAVAAAFPSLVLTAVVAILVVVLAVAAAGGQSWGKPCASNDANVSRLHSE